MKVAVSPLKLYILIVIFRAQLHVGNFTQTHHDAVLTA